MHQRKLFHLIYLTLISLSLNAVAAASEVVSFSGDLRYRHESKEQGSSDANHRQRLRARFKATGQVNDATKLVLRLSSGGNGVTSTNQTLGDSGANKDFDLDQAYVNYLATDSVSFRFGKMDNPLYRVAKSQLIWDGDVTPEGMAVSFDCKCENSTRYFATLAGFWLDDRGVSAGSDESDAGITAAQLGGQWDLIAVDLIFGASYYEFTNLKGRATVDPGGKMKGNSDTKVTGFYDNEYKVAEVFLEAGGEVSGVPVAIFYDVIANNQADENNKGSSAGIKIGKAKDVGSFGLQFEFRELERDASLGALSDGDFAGGGTDGRGSVFSLKYVVAKNSVAKLTYYDNEEGIDSDTDFKLIHADFVWKF